MTKFEDIVPAAKLQANMAFSSLDDIASAWHVSVCWYRNLGREFGYDSLRIATYGLFSGRLSSDSLFAFYNHSVPLFLDPE